MWQRASQWLGRDAADGTSLAQPEMGQVPPDAFHEMTAAPRRYGFHGTLKAPFRLAEGRSEAELADELAAFCAVRAPFDVELAAGILDGFVALLPEKSSPRLDQLAADVVRGFEAFRAPLSDADMARRRPDRLDEVERDHLMRWGYPHVFDRFRFHMTLSGRLATDEASLVREFAQNWFADFLARPVKIEGLALFVEKTPETPFMLMTHVPFGATNEERPPE